MLLPTPFPETTLYFPALTTKLWFPKRPVFSVRRCTADLPELSAPLLSPMDSPLYLETRDLGVLPREGSALLADGVKGLSRLLLQR